MSKGERYRAPRPTPLPDREPNTAYERFLQKLAPRHPAIASRTAADVGQDEPGVKLMPRKKRKRA